MTSIPPHRAASAPDADHDGLMELSAVAGLIGSTVIDGVPTIFAPGRGNLMTAGLVFRVGWADESLATRGITHLIEHLALFGLGAVDAHHNGETSETLT